MAKIPQSILRTPHATDTYTLLLVFPVLGKAHCMEIPLVQWAHKQKLLTTLKHRMVCLRCRNTMNYKYCHGFQLNRCEFLCDFRLFLQILNYVFTCTQNIVCFWGIVGGGGHHRFTVVPIVGLLGSFSYTDFLSYCYVMTHQSSYDQIELKEFVCALNRRKPTQKG